MSKQTTLQDLTAIYRFMSLVEPGLPVALQLANLEDATLAHLKQHPRNADRIIQAAGTVAEIVMFATGRDRDTASRLSSDFVILLIRQLMEQAH